MRKAIGLKTDGLFRYFNLFVRFQVIPLVAMESAPTIVIPIPMRAVAHHARSLPATRFPLMTPVPVSAVLTQLQIRPLHSGWIMLGTVHRERALDEAASQEE
jgi:hypothetical protein